MTERQKNLCMDCMSIVCCDTVLIHPLVIKGQQANLCHMHQTCVILHNTWFLFSTLGYRCLKMVLFFSGFMSGTAAILLLYNKEPVLDSHLSAETKAGIGLGVGVLCGLITLLVSTIGFVLSGLQLGSLLCLGVLVFVGQFCILTPVWVPLGAALAASIITAVLTLLWQKLFTILYTSVLGAMTVMLCVDYVVGTFVLPEQVYDMFHQGTPSRPPCWFDWAVAGMCPLLSLIGGLVQWKCTASGLSHTQGELNEPHIFSFQVRNEK